MYTADRDVEGIVANNLAMLIANLQDADDEPSLARAIELTQSFGSNGQRLRFLNTFGWVRLKNGEAIAALPVLQKAAEMDP